jgi:hypothetical protein
VLSVSLEFETDPAKSEKDLARTSDEKEHVAVLVTT